MEIQAFMDGVGNAVLDGDAEALGAFVASWLGGEEGAAELLAALDEVMDEYADELEVELEEVVTLEVDEGDATIADLREEAEDFPAEITEENFVGWYCVQGQDDTGMPWFDMWVAVVKQGETLVIGHYEILDPDVPDDEEDDDDDGDDGGDDGDDDETPDKAGD